MCREFLGYHGTTAENYKTILNEGFKMSGGGWLGKGVYFFEEDFDMALSWAKKKYRTANIKYVKRNIKTPAKELFDITNPLSKDTKYYFTERQKYIDDMKRRGFVIKVDAKNRYENGIMNLICTRKGYNVVRAFTYTYNNDSLDSIFANGIEICVKKIDYINNCKG